MFVLCFILIILYTKEKLFCVKYMFMFVLCFMFYIFLSFGKIEKNPLVYTYVKRKVTIILATKRMKVTEL